jgi:uncharacterized membrane protein YgcG
MPQQQQALSPQQMDSLVAPVALYPDPLLSQVLAASTYPLEIAEAEQWVEHNQGMQGKELEEAARQQNWDPSIQALVAFPDVLGHLASDLRWTTDLGNAFLAQQADVMQAVQRMRARAMAEGRLRSNQQETVNTEVQNGQSAIDIQPANPEVIYVPQYNPEVVFGPPAWGYYPEWDFGFGFGFGPGIYIGGLFPGIGWGGWGWGCNWFGGFVFQRPFFFAHAGFWGYHGGWGAGWRGGWGDRTAWTHDPGHRGGVGYPNASLAARYGGAARFNSGFNRGVTGNGFAGSRYQTPGARTGVGTNNGWRSFNGNGTGTGTVNRGVTSNSLARTSPSTGRSFGTPSYRPASPSNTRSSVAAPHYSAPSYSRSYSAPSYSRSYSAPSYSRSYSVPSYNRSYSAPSYSRSYSAPAPHYSAPSSSRSYSAPSRSSSGGGSFHGGGGGFHGGGGGGGSHGGGGHR